MNARPLLACLLIASTALPGCISFPSRDAPETRRYMIEVRRPGDPAPTRSELALEVRRFHANAAYADRKLVSRGEQAMAEADYYHELFVPPAISLSEATRSWLSDSGRFTTVHGAGMATPPDVTVHGDLLALYGDYRDAPVAILDVHFTVVNHRTGMLVLERTFRERAELDDTGPATLVAGYRRALLRVLTELEQALVEELKSR